MSLLQEFKWQRNKYPWNIQVKWAARTKTVWQLHSGQLYRCYPDCCAMILSSHLSFRIKICTGSQVQARYSKILQINTRSIHLASSTFEHEGYFPLKYGSVKTICVDYVNFISQTYRDLDVTTREPETYISTSCLHILGKSLSFNLLLILERGWNHCNTSML